MSNIIPPLVSSSPPPMVANEADDLDEDEFGDFTAVREYSFDGYSLPSTPQHVAQKSSHLQTNLNSPLENYSEVKHTISSSIEQVTNQFVETSLNEHHCTTDFKHAFCDINSDDVNIKNVDEQFVHNYTKSLDNENEIQAIRNQSEVCTEQNVEVVPKSKLEFNENGESKNTKDLELANLNECKENGTEVVEKEFGDFEDHKVIECTKETIVHDDCSKTNNHELQGDDDFDEFVYNSGVVTVNSTIRSVDENCTNFIVNDSCINVDKVNEINDVLLTNKHVIVTNQGDNSQNESELVIKDNVDYTLSQGKEENECDFLVNFPQIHTETVSVTQNSETNHARIETVIDDFGAFQNNEESSTNDDFGDFTQESCDDFGDFNSPVLKSEDDLDDFGDFSNYPQQEKTLENLQMSVHDAENVIKDSFTCVESTFSDFQCVDFTDNDVFRQVQDIENTNALNYQWTNSEGQKLLLQALNIDSRNILFGPRWNSSMPRFAANLGFTPLEPVKTELPLVAQQVMLPQTEQTQCDIPAAKFDWISSGLTNPLDYSQANTMLFDLEQLVTSLDISHLSVPETGDTSLDLDSWEYWLQNQPSDTIKLETIEEKLSTNTQADVNVLGDNESVNSLKFIEPPVELENELKLNNENQSFDKITSDDTFTNFQSSKIENGNNWTSNLIPLRETYISTQSEAVSESSKNSDVNIEPEYLTKKEVEDDFNDFQMSLPERTPPVTALPLEPLKPIILETSPVQVKPEINWPEPGIVSDDLNEFQFAFTPTEQSKEELKEPITIPREDVKKTQVVEEDDWSDFVSVTKSTENFSNLFQNISQQQQLELSVPNLQLNHAVLPNVGFSYQPPYQIPVQTINTPFGGLPQTSLSSFSNFGGPTEKANLTNSTSTSNPFSNSGVQSIENTFRHLQQPKSVPNDDDDDDWCDFVSSVPTTSTTNQCLAQPKSFENVNKSTGWSANLTPNIITNPVHFVQPNSHVSKKSGNTVQSQVDNKNSVPVFPIWVSLRQGVNSYPNNC